MAPSSENQPKLSVVVVAVDNDRDLQASIRSVSPIADEIVVGQIAFADAPDVAEDLTENPRETPAGVSVRYLSLPWQQDFSAARNACLEAASGDWLLLLDGGELLSAESLTKIGDFIAFKADANKVYRLLIQSPAKTRADTGAQISQCRLLPNRPELHFSGPVRESLEASIAACGLESEQLDLVVTLPENGERDDFKLRRARMQLRVCEHIRSEETTDPRLWLARGEALADLGEWKQAEHAFSQARRFAVEGSAELLEAYYGELRSLDREADLQESQLTLCIEALKQFPVDVQLLCAMGNYLHQQQRIDLATRAYQTAVRHGTIHPTSWHLTEIAQIATTCLSISLELEDRVEEARGVLEDALLEQPNSFRLRHQLIDLHVRHGRRKEAIEQVSRFPTEWPHRDALANAVRGACLAGTQNWSNAEAYLQTAFDAGCRDILCLRWLTLTHAALEHYDAAQEILDLWRDEEPESQEVQKLTASLLTRKFGQTAQAVASGSPATLPPHFPLSPGAEGGARKRPQKAEVHPGSMPEEAGPTG
ncbi:MAG: glycosyltransferase [Planctomycetota bacterium]|nr:glycosyltransferase [Planctomycetota bacterium]